MYLNLRQRKRKNPSSPRVHASKLYQQVVEAAEKLMAKPPANKVTRLADMSPEKQAEMMRLYGRKS